MGVLHIVNLHIFREKPRIRFIIYTLLMLVSVILQLVNFGTVPTVPLIAGAVTSAVAMMTAYFCMTTLYNGKKGKHTVFAKWFFYTFYPVHYLIIWAVYKF